MNPPGFVKVAPYSRFTEARQSGPEDDTDLLDFDRGVEAEVEAQSLNTHLPSSNMGYKLALKMGWKEGHGLGKKETGKCPLSPHQRPEEVIQTMNWIVCHYPQPQPIHCVSEGWHWRSVDAKWEWAPLLRLCFLWRSFQCLDLHLVVSGFSCWQFFN